MAYTDPGPILPLSPLQKLAVTAFDKSQYLLGERVAEWPFNALMTSGWRKLVAALPRKKDTILLDPPPALAASEQLQMPASRGLVTSVAEARLEYFDELREE